MKIRENRKCYDSLSSKTRQASDGFCRMIFRSFGATALILATVLFITSCADSAADIADKAGGITAAQIIENPSAYVGKTVTVSGDVEEIHGPRAFNMDSGASLGELLVVGREPFPQIPEAGNRAYVINDVATVTGVVKMFVAADVEREIGWDLDPKLEAEFNAKPVLIAQKSSFRAGAGNKPINAANAGNDQSATNADADRTTTDKNSNQGRGNADANQATTNNKITDAGVYASTKNKLSLAGREAEFSNLRVARVVGPRTFTVASGSDEIYVMLDEESSKGVGTQGKIETGKTLSLTGKFERLQAEEISDIADNRFRALTEQERAFLKKTAVYLRADKISSLK